MYSMKTNLCLLKKYIMVALSMMSVSSFAQTNVVGYFPTYQNFPNEINNIDLAKLTHLNIAFANPNSSGAIVVDGASNSSVTTVVNAAHAKNVKVLLSIGGAGAPGNYYHTAFSNSTNMTNFVNACVNYTTTYNLDGIDVDIEGDVLDGNQVTSSQYQSFVTQLASALHAKNKIMTAAVADWFGSFVTNTAAAQFDFIGVMAYDEHIPGSGDQPGPNGDYQFAVDNYNYWHGKGVPGSKINIGVPFYGYGWGSYAGDPGGDSYASIVAKYPGAENSDVVGSGANAEYYNGIPTIKQKTAFAIQNGGGIMIWDITMDATGSKSLLTAINQVIVANTNPVPDNLAKGKTVTVSSTEANTTVSTAGSNAVDGSYATRWSSLFADPQWITVDLGANYSVNRVKLTWEAAYASAYQIQLSSDNTNWTTLKSITGNTTTTNDQTGLSGTGRYVRIYGTSRATTYGYSLYEIEVYGTAVESPYNGSAIALPGTIQAENYDLGGEGLAYHDSETANQGGVYRTDGVDIEASTDAGGGYDVGWTAAGEWLKYSVNVNTSGNYTLGFRTAGTSAGAVSVLVDGANVTGTVNLPNTGGWQTWATTNVSNINLTAGQHIVEVLVVTAGFNLNYVSVTTTNQAPSISLTSPASNATFTAPASVTINATASDADGTVSKVDFYNGSTLLGTANTSPYSFTWSNVATGSYSITAKAIDNSGAVTTSGAVSITVNAVVSNCPNLTWSDEFNGTSLDQTKWSYQTGDGCPGNCGWGNNELEYYTSSTNNVNVSGGNLAIVARNENNYNGTGKNFTSGKLVTSGKFSQKYGRYEARVKVPSASGTWPAFWMLADNTQWPATGEIDILECANANPTTWFGTLHYASTAGVHQSKGSTWTSSTPLSNDFHVYACEWNTDQISWYVDGVLRGTATKAAVISGGGAWPFDDQKFFIILNLAVGGNFTGQTPNPAEYPQTMLVDYVRVYSGDPCTVPESPYNGTAVSLPGIIQAENYDLGSEGISYHDSETANQGGVYRTDGVDIEASTDAGGGYDVGWTAAGEWLKYTVNVSTSGSYNFAFRTAGTSAGAVNVLVDGVNVTGTVNLPNTGGWQTWATTNVSNINLTAGQHIVEVLVVTAGFNLNYISVTANTVSVNQAPSVSLTSPANNATFSAPASVTINATASDVDGTVSKVDFYNGSTLLGTDNTSPYSFVWSNVAAGSYSITAKATDNSGATTISGGVSITVNTVTTTNPCSGVPQYVENGGYVAGSTVQSGGVIYQCKSYPYTGWCNGAAWAYGPGTGTAWTDAWTQTGTCSNARIGTLNDAASTSSTNVIKNILVPNPTTGVVSIAVNNSFSVQILNNYGQEVMSVAELTANGSIDITGLAAGIYVVKIISEGDTITQQLIKQ